MDTILIWVEAHRALVTASTSIVVTLLTLGGGFLIGQGLTAKWNIRVKEREADINAIPRVRELYGELLGVRRSWEDHLAHKGVEGWEDRRSKLLDKACDAEGELEGIILKIAGERKLTENEIDQLGFVRQAYQQPRECIRCNKIIPWFSSGQCQYLVLKLGTQALTNILYKERSEKVPPGQFGKLSENFPFEEFKHEKQLVSLIRERKVFKDWPTT